MRLRAPSGYRLRNVAHQELLEESLTSCSQDYQIVFRSLSQHPLDKIGSGYNSGFQRLIRFQTSQSLVDRPPRVFYCCPYRPLRCQAGLALQMVGDVDNGLLEAEAPPTIEQRDSNQQG